VKTKLLLTTVLACLAFCVATSQAGQTGSHPVQTAVREYIDANMPWPPGTVRVDFLSEEAEAAPLDRNTVLRIEPSGNTEFIGDVAFLVRFFKNGNLIRTESARTRIEVLRDVVVAAKMLSTGAVLKDSDLRVTRKWVRRIHPQAVNTLGDIAGKRLTAQVTAGTEIMAFMLKDAPLVRKGKMVKMVFDNGPMQIITVGLPEEDGIAGSIIRVRNVTSNKVIYARVLSDSLVGIEF
jgi:flagella basal body P-ring formation protein FlgA